MIPSVVKFFFNCAIIAVGFMAGATIIFTVFSALVDVGRKVAIVTAIFTALAPMINTKKFSSN